MIIHHLVMAGAGIQNDVNTGILVVAAAELGDINKLRSYKLAGVDIINIRDASGRTIMHVASLLGHEDILRMVRQCDANAASVKDYLGMTPEQYEHLGVAHKVQSGPCTC